MIYRNDPKVSDRYAWANSVDPDQRSSLIRVYTVCHSVCTVWIHYFMVEPHSSNFRAITTNILGVRIFREFTVFASLFPGERSARHCYSWMFEPGCRAWQQGLQQCWRACPVHSWQTWLPRVLSANCCQYEGSSCKVLWSCKGIGIRWCCCWRAEENVCKWITNFEIYTWVLQKIV